MNVDTGEIVRLTDGQIEERRRLFAQCEELKDRLIPLTEREASFLAQHEPSQRPAELLLNRAARRAQAAQARRKNARR